MDPTTGAEALVGTLQDLGVDTVFGIPGIHNLDIYDRLIHSRIRHVTSRNESGAAFMADGYARGRRRPGVALVISGPGVTNALTGLGESLHDSVPVVLISSDIPRPYADGPSGYLHQLKNPTTMTRSVTKASIRVEHAAEIPESLAYLYRLAGSGRPGPVHLEVPIDVLQEPLDPLDDDTVSAVVELLRGAQRPVVIAGGGSAGDAAGVTAFVEHLDAPVVTTAAGKGVVPESHPLSLGGRLHLPSVRSALEDADLVVTLGTQLSPTDLWVDRLRLTGRLLAVNVDGAHLSGTHEPDVAVCAPVGDVLPRLTTALAAAYGDAAVGSGAARASRVRDGADDDVPTTLGLPTPTVARMRSVLSAISAVLGEHGILTADMTSIAYCAISEYATETPGSFLHPAGFGTLGFALPAAIGVAIRREERPVVALVGDGGFQFTMQEFGVAVEEQVPLPIVLWNDGGYGEIRREEELRHPGRRIAVDHAGPDFCALAASYGAPAERIDDPGALSERLRAALHHAGPTLLEVRAS